jgi:DNA-binding MarR family transcriptional regulator
MTTGGRTTEPKAARGNHRPYRPAPRFERTKIGLLDGFVGFNLRIAQEASFRTFAGHAGMRQLKPGRFAAMMVIHNNPGIAPVDLSRAIARDKSSVTPLIQDLERRGFVKRTPSPTDRRSVTLTLTRAGQGALKRLLGHAREHDDKLDAIVGDEKADFVRILKKIADTLA